MIWILSLAYILSLGLNAHLLYKNSRLRKALHEGMYELAQDMQRALENRINDVRPKRDAHGRFTR